MSVRDTKKASYDELIEFAEGIDVTVGVHETEGAESHGELTNVALAEQHEFGLGVPQRSFIRAWADENESKNRKLQKTALTNALKKGLTLNQAAEQIALAYEGSVKQRISRGIPPPNSKETQAAKGSATPLIDTGALRASIRGKVNA